MGGVRRIGTVRMIGCLVALALLASSTAEARRRRGGKSAAVQITSKPKGARVTTDTGEVIGKTPLSTELPLGTHILTLEKAGYAPFEYAIDVTRKKRKNRWRFRLKQISAIQVSLVGASSRIKGAAIYVDGEQVGTVPGKFEIARGGHQVEVRKRGYVAHEEYVELRGGVHKVAAVLEPLTTAAVPPESEPEADFLPESEQAEASATKSGDDDGDASAAARRGPWVVVGAGVELGGRRFRYDNPQTANMRDFDAGLPMVRLSAEVYPLTGMRKKFLSGLSLGGRFARGAPTNSTTSDGMVVGTGFGDWSIGLGYRVPLGKPSLVGDGWDAGGGVSYGRQFFSFDDQSPLYTEVPAVDYRYWRLGAGVGSQFGRYRASGGVSYDIVRKAGALETRFTRDDVSGVGVGVGFGAQVWRALELRLAGNMVRYGHTFRFEEAAEFMADGASDTFFGVMAQAAYAY